MHPDDYRERLEMVRRQFELALKGDRPVFCALCNRPFRCHEVTAATSKLRVIWPYRHAIKKGRTLCPGSEMHAVLAPYK
tara:strand:+ start:948 stop:1184 length:237 start_codon:yes stop_codon:yes gene_type:complete